MSRYSASVTHDQTCSRRWAPALRSSETRKRRGWSRTTISHPSFITPNHFLLGRGLEGQEISPIFLSCPMRETHACSWTDGDTYTPFCRLFHNHQQLGSYNTIGSEALTHGPNQPLCLSSGCPTSGCCSCFEIIHFEWFYKYLLSGLKLTSQTQEPN